MTTIAAHRTEARLELAEDLVDLDGKFARRDDDES